MLWKSVIVAGAELRRRIRSRSALITSFVAPLAMAVVFGLMFGATDSGPSFVIGVADGAGTVRSGAITAGLLESDDEDGGGDEGGGVVFVGLADADAASAAVDDDEVDAAIVVGGDGSDVELIVIEDPSSPLTSQVAQSVASGIATSIETGGAPSVPLESLPVGGRELSAPAFFGASMAILLLFFSTGQAAQSILEDKENRTLDRILAGPTTLWSVLIGKVVAISVMAIAGFITVWLVTSVAFGAEWGSPPAVLVLIVFTIFALAGVATFVGGLASTAQQALTLTAVVTFGLSLLGGNFSGPADAPAALRAVRGWTPNGRALEAFTELSVDAASVGSIANALVVLALFGLVFGGIGLATVRRRFLA